MWAEDCRWVWRRWGFHSARSGGLSVAAPLSSTMPGTCAMPPTPFGEELKYYTPHKDQKRRPSARWAGVDRQPSICRCCKIQAAAVFQRLRTICHSDHPRSVLLVSAGLVQLVWGQPVGKPDSQRVLTASPIVFLLRL